ncbi:Rtr1/RPAP2 family protein phosphatase [Sporobolomyces koalae]|uniref:Rtr1/RPAP2 family protein phosphatase n=1 Tax=Sporobolomyces koalae TaxID=500713 RepID=UPI00317D6148
MPALPASHAIPTSFRVATSTTPRSTTAEEESLYDSFHSAAASRAISTASPTSLARKLEWIERLSVPGVSLETLKASLEFLDPTSWADLVVERHMEALCPYPSCSNRASTEYTGVEGEDTEGRFEGKFKLHGGGLFDARPTTGAKDKGPYCSTRCRARSDWIKALLAKEGPTGGNELLEDVEKRRQQVRESTDALVKEQQTQQQKSDAKETFKTDLLSTLTIREKPSSTKPPVAPSLDSAAIDFERPASASANSKESSRFPLDPSNAPTRALRNSSSALLPFTTSSLGRTILSSSRRSTPVPAARQPRIGINGLPPVRFLSEPRMIDERGREIEWAEEEIEDDEQGDLVRELMAEAIEVRRLVEKGEL